jgi:Xaa-Pro aminopeptidase
VPRTDRTARRDALRVRLDIAGLDALLVTDLVDVRYLTGFTGSNAALLVHADGEAASRFCTDGRYRLQAAAEAPGLETVIDRECAETLAAAAAGLGVRRLGFASDHVTVDAHAGLVTAAGDVVLERAPGLVALLRTVKDVGEVAAVRAACAAADAALADLIAGGGIAPGRTEIEVALDLEQRMRAHGADDRAFDTIVAAGPHSAIPHHRPTGSVLRRGDLVKLDFGAVVDGYHSDMTRTVVIGPAAPWQEEIHAVVAAGQAAGRAAARDGAALAGVDAAARHVISAAGYGEQFFHGLGHGVGLQIHEAPLIAGTSEGALAAGMVVTVEPGVYLDGRGGVRIEDTIVVGRGEPMVLTRSPRELLEC